MRPRLLLAALTLAITASLQAQQPPSAVIADLRSLHDTHLTTVHLATDHSYSGQRIALETAVINWLNHLPR